jgi:hypothetical protein
MICLLTTRMYQKSHCISLLIVNGGLFFLLSVGLNYVISIAAVRLSSSPSL